jgi:two-component system cell cycle sensor histidine kinase/response regulator CckA
MTEGDSALNNFRINWVTLSFSGDLEKRFLESYFQDSLKQVRIALLMGLFLCSIFGFLDAWLVPEAKLKLWFIRYAIFAPYGLGILLFSFTRHFKKYMQLSMALSVLITGMGIIAMILIAPYPASHSYYAGLLLVFIYGYNFARLRFLWASITGWLIVIAYEFAAIWLSPTPIPILINNNFFFLSANIMCMFACYSAEYYLRQNYIQSRSLEAEKKKVTESNCKLEKRVRERTLQLVRSNKVLKQEIVERQRAENALRQSEEKYRLLIENADMAIFIAQDKTIKFPNPRAIEMSGYSAGELPGLSVLDLIHPEDQGIIFGGKRQEPKDGFPKTCIFRIINKNKEMLWAQLNTVRITWEGQPATLNFLKDITEQKKLEDRLQRAKKMEAIGTLAGGVAHDLNNILSGIVSYPELLLLDIDEDSPLRKPLVTIRESGQKAATIVQDLLTLARRGVCITEVINLNQVINQYLHSPEHQNLIAYHPNVGIETVLEENMLNTLGSSVHLSKVIMNLISNAAEAMPEGGRIQISTKNCYVDRPLEGYHTVDEGDYVVVTVSDNGLGISSTDIDRIFEPFYSKKKMGRCGTGLGMAVVWGAVKDHKGYIDVKSTVGKGTTFRLYFPVTRRELAVDDRLSSIKELMGNGESILVVDDVREQREIACGMLKKLGYQVKSVSGGEAAVAFLNDNKVDLMVLDMIMHPGIDGLETYKRSIQIQPELLTIIASGYAETRRVREAQKLGAGEYIKKPYSLLRIGQAVKNELSKNSTRKNLMTSYSSLMVVH